MIRILSSLISVPNFERAGHQCNFKIQYNRNYSYTYSLFKFEEITTSHKSIVVYKQTSIIENSFILYCSGVRILKLLVTQANNQLKKFAASKFLIVLVQVTYFQLHTPSYNSFSHYETQTNKVPLCSIWNLNKNVGPDYTQETQQKLCQWSWA